MNNKTLCDTRLQRFALVPALLSVAVLLAACGSSVPLKEPTAAAPVETRAATPDAAAAAAAAAAARAAAAQSAVASVNLAPNDASDAQMLAGQRIVYFDFDSFTVRDESRQMLEAHARRLAAQRGMNIVVEGHTDERGGREYNLALGQRRAEAVARTMELLGANRSQIEAVSFGKERPAAQGSSEEAFAQNRRAEIKDR